MTQHTKYFMWYSNAENFNCVFWVCLSGRGLVYMDPRQVNMASLLAQTVFLPFWLYLVFQATVKENSVELNHYNPLSLLDNEIMTWLQKGWPWWGMWANPAVSQACTSQACTSQACSIFWATPCPTMQLKHSGYKLHVHRWQCPLKVVLSTRSSGRLFSVTLLHGKTSPSLNLCSRQQAH